MGFNQKATCLTCDNGVCETVFGRLKGVRILHTGICEECLKNNKIPSFTKYNEEEPDDNLRKQIIKQINDEMIVENVSQKKIDLFNEDIDFYEKSEYYIKLRANKNKTPEQIEKEEKEKKEEESKRFANHIVTTTVNIEGYRIVKYHGVVSGYAVFGTSPITTLSASAKDLAGERVTSYENIMAHTEQAAEIQVKKKSVKLGGNAIVGASINITSFSSDMIGILYSGTSVTIEPITNVNDTNSCNKND